MDAGQQVIASHFDIVAKEYDHWKKRNWYYYDTLYDIARRYAKGAANLLDVGCGTGAMINAVAPLRATGIDVSPSMVELARRNNAGHPSYTFEAADIVEYHPAQKFDRILFFDVIEHVTDQPQTIRALHDLLLPGGKLVVLMANPLWEPVLMAAERRGLKMPEGPHHRIWGGELLRLASDAGLTLVGREWRLIFPKYIPGFSWLMNDVIGRIPLIRRLAVIEVFVFTR